MMFRLLALVFFIASGSCHKYFSPFDFLKYERGATEIDPAIQLKVTPNILKKSGDWLTLTWSGVSNPSKDDWIGVYAPPSNGNTVDPQKQAPIKFQYCNHSPDHVTSGQGSFKFRLVNVRVPYIIALLRGGFDSPTLAAVSNVIHFTNPCEPLQGHLALTNDPTTVMLTWVSDTVSEPAVKVWQNLTTYIRIIPATTSTYSVKDMCGPPATTVGYMNPGYIYTATIKGLTPGHEYNYQFGDKDCGWSEVFSFKVPPRPDPNASLSIIAFGDMGEAQVDDTRQIEGAQLPALNTTKLIEQEMKERDLLLHIGDISYATGYAGVWDEFFDLIQPIATRLPYMVCGGNHERDFPDSGSFYTGLDSGGECGIPYEKRFIMPRPRHDQHWYGFSVGSVHIVLMSTELNFTVGSDQYNWLKDHLASVDRSLTPWLIFAGHRPMYIDSSNVLEPAGDIPVAISLQKNIEDLLMQYEVDLVLWGHHHSYQRTCPVYQMKCVSKGPVHVVIGMAGQGLSKDIKIVEPNWLEYIDVNHYGFTRIIVTPESMKLEYVHNDDGNIHDTYEIRH